MSHTLRHQSSRVTLAALAFLVTADQALGADADRWQLTLMPYLWFPAVDASADLTVPSLRGAAGDELGPVSARADTEPSDYLDDLDMAFMAMAEARRGPWSVYTDVLYTSFGDADTRLRQVTGLLGNPLADISRKARVDLSTTTWTLAPGYRAIEQPTFELDLMAGFRYLAMNSDLKIQLLGSDGRFFREREISLDQAVWDGIVGVRGQILFPGTRWLVPYYVDVGTGGSNLTWQAMLGVGYRFDWGEVTLAYRALGYELDDNDTDFTLYGPGLGVGFRW